MEAAGTLIVYLDTQIAVWLAGGEQRRLTGRARTLLNKASPLISPMVLLELEYLYEINRFKVTSRDVERKLMQEAGIQVCSVPFADVARAAVSEKWTREPFDRMIVANAKAAGLAPLVTADENIRAHYPRAVW